MVNAFFDERKFFIGGIAKFNYKFTLLFNIMLKNY